MNARFGSIFLALFSSLLAVVLGELILTLADIGYYSFNHRVLFYSHPSFVSFGEDAVRYAADTDIRTVAIYGELIDYDTRNRTNNLGFYDTVDYPIEALVAGAAAPRNVAFVGDSFTAGSGGSKPWVAKLRERKAELGAQQSNAHYYNFGVSGTGINEFHHLIQQVHNQISLHEINLMVITSDFFRPVWYPLYVDQSIRFCPQYQSQADCRRFQRPVIYEISGDESHSDLLARAAEIYQLQDTNYDEGRGFVQSLRTIAVFCTGMQSIALEGDWLKSLCPHLRRFEHAYSHGKDAQFYSAVDAIRDLSVQYPSVRFRVFHIPERSEVLKGKYAVNIVNEMREIGVEYVPLLKACKWQKSAYHKHDGHFNDHGYSNLTSCMVQYVN